MGDGVDHGAAIAVVADNRITSALEKLYIGNGRLRAQPAFEMVGVSKAQGLIA